MINAKTFLDINIAGLGSYTNNNFVFISNTSIASLIGGKYETVVEFDKRRLPVKAFNREFVAGPGATWNKGDHAIGLSINGRSYSAVQSLPSFSRPFIEYGVQNYVYQHNVDYNIQKVRLASLNFAEIKGSYAYTFLKENKSMFVGGVSLKKFYSIAGGAATIHDANFNVNNDSVIAFYNLNADAMYTPNVAIYNKGGAGIDLGFTYMQLLRECKAYLPHTSKNGCRYVPYKYKLGFSIIDIGAIKFEEENVNFAGYNFNSQYEWLHYTGTKINGNALDLFAEQEQDITTGHVQKTNKIKLPTFISAQFDYNIWASAVYINATIIQGMPHGSKSFGIRHANSLSITPRYETKWIDFAIPFSLYEYSDPQLGISFRVGPITIGSDKFISWIYNDDLYGGDLYFYAKIPIHYHPDCKKLLRRRDLDRRSKTGKSKIDCMY
jgi:hypothetical protein